MADPWAGARTSITGPGENHTAVTPSDTVDLTVRARSLWVGVGGDVAVRDQRGVDAIYKAGDGSLIPFRAVRVLATGTTATNIVAFW